MPPAGHMSSRVCVRQRDRRLPISPALVGRSTRRRPTEAGVDELLRPWWTEFATATTCAPKDRSRPDRLDNIRELIASAAETVIDEGGEVGLTPLEHFLQRTSLVAGVDQLDPSADAIV